MVLGQPGPAGHALRLEPDERLDASDAGVFADRAQPPRKAFQVGLPRAGLRPSVARIPTRRPIHQKSIGDALLDVAVDEEASDSPRWRLHISLNSSEVLPGHDRRRHFAVGRARGRLWAIIQRRQRFLLPAGRRHLARTSAPPAACGSLSPGWSTSVGELLAGHDPQPSVRVASEAGRPLARPAHGQDHPPAGHAQVEVRKCVIGGPPTDRDEPRFDIWRQNLLQRLIEVRCAGIPLVVSEQILLPLGPLDLRVDRLEAGSASMCSICRVFLKVHRPLHDGKVGVFHRHATDLQIGLGIGPRQCVLRTVLGKLAALALPRPSRQQLAGRLPAR